MNWFTYVWIQVHWIDKINLWIFLRDILHSRNHTDEAIAKILTSMPCNQNKFLAISKTSNVIASFKQNLILFSTKRTICLEFLYNHVESIYNSVTCYENFTMNIFFLEILFRKRSWCKVIISNTTYNLAVHLLWPWRIKVMSAKACLYMTYRNLCIECSKSARSRCGCVTMNKYYIRTILLEQVTKTYEDTSSNIC